MKKNVLITIGLNGMKRCYLNISEEQAIERYSKRENISIEEITDSDDITIDINEFVDEFGSSGIFEN